MAAQRQRHPVLCGALAGFGEILITYPMEHIKCRQQLLAAQSLFPSLLEIGSGIWRKGGRRELYHGHHAWVAFSFPRSAIRFTAFEVVRNELRCSTDLGERTATLLAGIAAGAAECAFALGPLQSVQVKIVNDAMLPASQRVLSGGNGSGWPGFFRSFIAIARTHGIAGYFDGVLPTIVKGALNQAVRFSVFTELMRAQRASGGEDGVLRSLVYGAIAGGTSVVISHPIDCIKTNMMNRSFSTSLACARHIWRTGGVGGFYVGLGARSVRVCAEVALQMSLYIQICKAIDAVW